MLKRILLSLAFLVAFCGIAEAQIASEIANGGGTAGAITAAPGSGTAGRIPQFASATSVVDSKMLTSGTNSGTWTLYDSTGGSGLTRLILRAGDTQADGNPLLEVFNSAGASMSGGYGVIMYNSGSYYVVAPDIIAPARSSFALAANGLRLSTTAGVNFSENGVDYGSADVALYRSAAGILKVTDGSTGQGGIGLSDAAANTVSDALILRHATTDAGFGQDGFGTGLLFQGEDDAGNMNSMAQIQAVYTDSANGSEDAEFRLYGMVGGTLTRGLSFTSQMRGSGPPGIASTSGISIEADGPLILTTNNSATSIVFGNYQVAYFWKINSADGHFQPYTTNTYDIGTSSARVRAGYFADLDVYDPTATTGVTDLTLKMGEGQSDTNVLTIKNNAGTAVSGFHMYAGGNDYLVVGTSGAVGQLIGNYFTDSGESWLRSGAGLFVHPSLPASTAWIQGTNSTALADNTITSFTTISSAVENNVTAGHIDYTVVASDATTELVQTQRGSLPFLLVNENGTVTVTLGTVYGTAIDSAGGAALTNTFASSVSGTNATIRVTSDYDQATLTGTVTHTIRARVYIDSGTATVTPIP